MGTWDVDIFDDDIAQDVKAEFEEALETMNIQEATDYIIQSFADVLADEDEAAIVYLALAVLQIERGQLEEDIKNKALYIIETGQGNERWEYAGREKFETRRILLNKLKDTIRRCHGDMPFWHKK